MDRKDWLFVKSHAPHALGVCRSFFQDKYGAEWRRAITRHENLVDFFRTRGLDFTLMAIDEGWNFELRTPWGRLSKDGWRHREEAERQALLSAFRELETLIMHRREGA